MIAQNRNINKKGIIYFTIMLMCMIFIFVFSSMPQTESVEESYKVGRKISNVIKYGESADEKEDFVVQWDNVIRKIAHAIEYAVLSFFIAGTVFSCMKSGKARYAILIGIVYAISDEFHQYFVPGRGARVFDVCVDSIGVFVGVGIYILVSRWVNTVAESKGISI